MHKLILKNILILFLSEYIFQIGLAQDTITKVNSEKLIVKITEINPSGIKYKKLDTSDSTIYSESKSDVKSIIYSNGLHEQLIDSVEAKDKIFMWGIQTYVYRDKKIKEIQLHTILNETKNSEIQSFVSDSEKAKKNQKIIFAAIPFAAIAGGSAFFASVFGGYGDFHVSQNLMVTSAISTSVAVGCSVSFVLFQKKQYKNNRKAVNLYYQ